MMNQSILISIIVVIFQGIGFIEATSAGDSLSPFEYWLANVFDPLTMTMDRSSTNLCVGPPLLNPGLHAFQPDKCTPEYFACYGGAQYNATCPLGSVFDSTIDVDTCVRSENAQSDACLASGIGPVACDGKKDGPFAITNCNENYYYCINQIVTFVACPANQKFNDDTKSCNTDCRGPPGNLQEVPPFGCFTTTPQGDYPISACSPNYYSCDGATKTVTPKQCPSGRVYNSKTCTPEANTPTCNGQTG